MLLNLKVGDLSFDLRLELVRGAAQFGEQASGLTSHLRQLLRPKKNEGQEEKEDRVGKTHGFIIMRQSQGGNAGPLELVVLHRSAPERRTSTELVSGPPYSVRRRR